MQVVARIVPRERLPSRAPPLSPILGGREEERFGQQPSAVAR